MVKVFLLGKGEKLDNYEIVLVTDPSKIPIKYDGSNIDF